MTAQPIRVAHVMPFPVEYFVPLYREVARRPEVELTVYYFSDATTGAFHDPLFGREVEWDIPLLGGYDHRFLPSASRTGIEGAFFRRPNWDIVAAVARGDYDVVWSHGYAHATTVLAAAGARARGTRWLLRDAQNLLQPRPLGKRILKRVALAALYRLASGAYVGEEARRHFLHYGMPASRLYPAVHCVDDALFGGASERLAPQRDEVRRSFGIDDGAPVILTCGKLVAHKQPLELIQAFARVVSKGPAWLLLAGDGPLRADAEALVARLGLDRVRFAGFLNQTEISRAYAAADVFCLPSTLEVWGMVVNEAMYFSLPLVLSDKVGAARDLVDPGCNGVVFPAGNVEALADALSQFVADPDLRAAAGRRSRELVQAYSVSRAADSLVAALLATAGRTAPYLVEVTA